MAVVSQAQIELANIKFQNLLRLMLQQEQSVLGATALTGTHTGSKQAAPIEYMAPTQFTAALPRGSDLPSNYSNLQRRWVSPTPFEHVVDVDSFDELLYMDSPKSLIPANILAAANRKKDDVMIASFFADATIGGVGATTTEVFDSGADFPISVSIADTVGAGSSTGLNIEKMLNAQEILGLYDNPENAIIHMGMTPRSLRDLMGTVEFTSTEFRNSATYDAQGRPMSFMGFNFHYSNRWRYNPSDSTERWLPVWIQDGMHLGTWMEVETVISQVNTKTGYPWRAYSMMSLGASRLQAGQVVRIAVQDTNGGPITP
jgi:hypothetical protein